MPVADSVNLYMDNSNALVVNRNLIYNTPNPSFRRPDLNRCASWHTYASITVCSYASGIQLANEGYPFPLNPLSGVTVTYALCEFTDSVRFSRVAVTTSSSAFLTPSLCVATVRQA